MSGVVEGRFWRGSGSRRGEYGPRVLAAAAVVALALLVGPASAGARIELRASGLEPGFRAKILDYTVPCSKPTKLVVRAPGVAQARIGDGVWFERSRRRAVQLVEGQAIKVAKRARGRRVTYWLRCLPADFPGYDFSRRHAPHYDHYIVDPGGVGVAPYVFIFSRWGVPVWWSSVTAAIDAKVIGRRIIWATDYEGFAFNTSPDAAYELHRPDGKLVDRVQAVGTTTDFHDLQQTPEGNFLLLSYRLRPGVDTSAFNGDEDATVYDGVVQEVTPDGQLVWEWSTADHIGLDETERWWPGLTEPYDIVHINAVELLSDGDLLISLRHTDAVYRLDRATGAIEWKLGGTPTDDSLTVLNDPLAADPLGAQHDIRYLGDGEISIHDNATDLGRAPRAVRYRVEGSSATLLEQRTDHLATDSRCCGSARYANGSWLISWGGRPLVTEFAPTGRRTFKLRFGGGAFSYRAVGVEGLDADDLRAGMNAQVDPKR